MNVVTDQVHFPVPDNISNIPLPPTALLPRAGRLRLEFARPSHAPVIQAIVGDERLARYTRLPHPYPGDGALIFIRESMEGRLMGWEYVFVILEHGILRGVCGIQHINQDERTGDLGYWVDPAQWGRGIATEAARAACFFAFRHLDLKRVTASHAIANAASGRVMEKIGFRRTHSRPDERIGDMYCYELTAPELLEAREIVAVEVAPGVFR